MAVEEYKVLYKDGSTQTVKSSERFTDGPWLVFMDGSGEVLRVPGNDVRGVQRRDVADREGGGPIIA